MRIPLGLDFFEANKGKISPLVYDTSAIINPHILLLGSSGVGKSHTIRKMVQRTLAAGANIRFHVFDVHGDLEIDGASVVQFSELSPFGLNPFFVNPDPVFGSLRKCIQAFIRTVNMASVTALGVKQESVLRRLILDVFKDFGFDPDDASTWAMNEYEMRSVSGGRDNRLYLDVPFADKDKAHALGARWDGAAKHWYVPLHTYKGDICQWKPAYKPRRYPTVQDVADYANRIYRERYLGSDQAAVIALGVLNKKAAALQRRVLDAVKAKQFDGYKDEAEDELADAREKAIDAFKAFAHSVRTGHEMDDMLRYDSPDVLKSVVDRLENLVGTGLFKKGLPPFDPSKQVWRYQLQPLSAEEKKMLVLFTLQDIFNKAMQRGQSANVVDIVVLDELGTYCSSADSESGDGIIGVIAREARKFGLGLWGAHQSPIGVPESLISSTGTKIILGIDEGHWPQAMTKLRMERNLLEFIAPHRTMAVQMKEKGATKMRWRWVKFDEEWRKPFPAPVH